jgi:hypothetical protein
MPLKSLSFVVPSDGSLDRRPGRYSLNVNLIKGEKIDTLEVLGLAHEKEKTYGSAPDPIY